MIDSNTPTEAQYDHEFTRVEIVGEHSAEYDGIVVEIETGGETYECPVPTGEYYNYGEVELVYAHDYELIARIVTDDGQIREAEISGDGVEEVREPNESAKSPEFLGAEVVYDARPAKVQRNRARLDTDLVSYLTEAGDTLYVCPDDYIDSEWADEDGIEDGARVAQVEIHNGNHDVYVGEYGDILDRVGTAYTLKGALEIAEDELER